MAKLFIAVILTVCGLSICRAVDVTTKDGTVYRHCEVSKVGPDFIVISYVDGVVTIPYDNLPANFQTQYFDPAKVAAYRKQVADQESQKAADVEAEREAQGLKKQQMEQAAKDAEAKRAHDQEIERQKQSAPSVSDPGTQPDTSSSDNQPTADADHTVKPDSLKAFGVTDAKEIASIPANLVGTMTIAAAAGPDDPTDIQVASPPRILGEITKDSVNVQGHTEKVNLIVMAWKEDDKGIKRAYIFIRSEHFWYVFHENSLGLAGVSQIMQLYPLVGDKAGKYFTFLLQ